MRASIERVTLEREVAAPHVTSTSSGRMVLKRARTRSVDSASTAASAAAAAVSRMLVVVVSKPRCIWQTATWHGKRSSAQERCADASAHVDQENTHVHAQVHDLRDSGLNQRRSVLPREYAPPSIKPRPPTIRRFGKTPGGVYHVQHVRVNDSSVWALFG